MAMIFYDIESAPPHKTFAPNPWKTRLALNLLKVDYKTEPVDMAEIADLRIRNNVKPNRMLPDGSEYHTLPMVQDVERKEFIGDSFEIALYLNKKSSTGTALFKENTIGLTAAFNAQVDTIFTKHVGIVDQMPFRPERKAAIDAIFAKRSHVESLDVMKLKEDQRPDMLKSFEAALGELSKAYRHTGGTTDHVWSATGTNPQYAQKGKEQDVGPWLDGDQPVYADLIVGAWLKMCERSMRESEWRLVRSWQHGLWGKIVDALDEYTTMK